MLLAVVHARNEVGSAKADRALEQLLRRNAALVQYWVQRSRWRGVVPDAELHAAGMIGLLRAIEKYDPTHETTLATYAAWWIRQAIDREAQSVERHRHMPLDFHGEERRDVRDRGADVEGEVVAKVSSQEAVAWLRTQLDELDEETRAMLETWVVVGGDSYELAARFDVPESTIRYRLAAAISRVRHPSCAITERDAAAWEARASCRGRSGDFFPSRGKRLAAALELCAECPVIDACREAAVADSRLVGVWGGLSERGRKDLRRSRRNEQ